MNEVNKLDQRQTDELFQMSDLAYLTPVDLTIFG